MKAPLVKVRAHQKRTNERWRVKDEAASRSGMVCGSPATGVGHASRVDGALSFPRRWHCRSPTSLNLRLQRNGEQRVDQPAVEDHHLLGKPGDAVVEHHVILV